MKILLIVLGLLLLLNLLLLTYPIRLAVVLDNRQAAVYWLPYVGRRVRIWQKKFVPSQVIAAFYEGDFEQVAALLFSGRAERQAESAPHRLSWRNVRALLGGGLAALRVRSFRLSVAIGGEPFKAAMLAGSLYAGLSAALARLSAAVASWQCGADGVQVTMLSPPCCFIDSRIFLAAEVSVAIWQALWQILRRIGRK